jgi:hypothetical protein
VKSTAWVSIAVLIGGASGIAWSCAGGGYETQWDAEVSNGMLSPANDTRSNFILLLSDRDGTIVADPAAMTKGIVPFDFPYKIMVQRMTPPGVSDGGAADDHDAAYGLSPDSKYFEYDSGNLGLCHTNRSGAEEFNAALNADARVPAGEKRALLSARAELGKACDKAGSLRFVLDGVSSPEGRAFGHYLEGARLFYAEDLSAAEQQFAAVVASSGWLTETASYMRFRTTLAAAMKGTVDQWGDITPPEKRDRAATDRADVARQAYLAAFPKGRYAASARGFERRIAWLRGDQAKLGMAYSALLRTASPAGGAPNIASVEEADRRVIPPGDVAGITDPNLLAVIDLMRLRPKEGSENYDYSGPPLDREALEQQRPHFRSDPALFGYLIAAEAYYGRHQPREVLQAIPDGARQARFGYVQFSRQVLRGLALDAVGDRNARAFWLSLLPGATQPYQRATIELALYRHDEKAGAIGRLLEAGSPILHPLIRQKVIEDDAGPELLRQQATAGLTRQQREVALYLLLANELHHGRYREFLGDQKLVGDRPQPKDADYSWWSVAEYEPTYLTELSPPPLHVFADGGSADLTGCPNIRGTASNLVASPAAIRPQLCLAEFIRRKGFDGWGSQYDAGSEAMVTRSRNGFPGKPIERMAIYMAVLASPAATADDKAFALNRAVRCYAPSGGNSCGGTDVDTPVRKAWYDRLKAQYPDSRWAKELKYYW